ncbi:hypothetical protein ACFP9V_19090 [Deinococcus radiopugnans]|uniref:hypothetical protein n=1 Tax=Deinococcus radiopugnans TaxID=57497 RepID=UPI003606956F
MDPRRPLLTLWRRYRRVQGYGEVIGGSPDWGTITATVQERTLGDWERDGVTPYYPEVRTVQTSSQLYWVISSAPTAPPPPPGQRWASPDGQVTVFGPYTDDHADLTDSELTAYGHTFAGGSWAALCGPVVTPERQTGGHPEPWILHELGNVITRITPDGEAQTMNRADFEAQTLRLNDRAFLRFNPVGTLFNTWPPQWAFAECGRGDTLEQVRAVALHDPWRDSVKAQVPEGTTLPPWWFWPARPRRRPPAAVSSAPLGLALADVLEAAGGTDPGGSS